ncbi:uncharacterized protein PHACADRAFT_25125 [Phanerochaete carnosa HHB-10118-sp]|uniref:Uncharacterized protein n=1 Tax=Phanerochaete carnosa (strain HHB-10118-sp) TaxID=650164 RepID=K5W519_PHACS|nr:uncharacterized protein PHACADRAFT_25125 [Phanerochaete carnosa HHB-10118-sp]EKM58993.1 hypothetical protein PHACADRAFT_25125 [Phanerochaete carnosa HHB-10118-sp]
MTTVTGGYCIYSTTPTGQVTYHCVYNTVIKSLGCTGSHIFFISAELHVYSPHEDLPLPDDTVVFIITRVYAPIRTPVLFEAIHVYSFSGDPSKDKYDKHLPNIPLHFLELEVVHFVQNAMPLDKSKHLILEASDYVRDKKKMSTVEAMFNRSTSRWAHIPLPVVQCTMQIIGTLSEFCHDSMLIIKIKSLSFNTLPPASDPATSASLRTGLGTMTSMTTTGSVLPVSAGTGIACHTNMLVMVLTV